MSETKAELVIGKNMAKPRHKHPTAIQLRAQLASRAHDDSVMMAEANGVYYRVVGFRLDCLPGRRRPGGLKGRYEYPAVVFTLKPMP